MSYRASFCDPLQREIIEIGHIDEADIIDKFRNTDWKKYLDSMTGKKEEEIYYSPSLEIENSGNMNGLCISAIGVPEKFDFMVMYKRPKTVSSFFGLSKKEVNEYFSDTDGLSEADVIVCLKALLKNDLEYLDIKIK